MHEVEREACDPLAGSRMQKGARRAIAKTVAAGVDDYQRERCLPGLLPMLPAEVADTSEGTRRRIVARLARALRAERMRGRAGHWTYDINRHIALLQAFQAERLALRAENRRIQKQKGPANAGPFQTLSR
jgi:hypothetical protein